MRRLTTRRTEFITPRRKRGRLGLLWKPLIFAALTFTVWQWSHAGLTHAKAWLAPILIERAWTESRVHRVNVKPWPWADTWPVARLTVPALNIEQFVLAGANGAALPFGPGHMTGTALPGEPGAVVIAGHRDTHFRFTADLPVGTKIVLESMDGRRRFYRVHDKAIVDSRGRDLTLDDDRDMLMLITCEPTTSFSARGPNRMVVSALALPPA